MPKMASDPSVESTHTDTCSPSTSCTFLQHPIKQEDILVQLLATAYVADRHSEIPHC